MSTNEGESGLQQVSSNLYLGSSGVMIFCMQCGGCRGGGGYDSPFRGQQEFLDRLKAIFPDASMHNLVNRYVQLGWMREQGKARMTEFGYSSEEIEAEWDATTVFLQKEEEQYVALGFQPIDFSGFDVGKKAYEDLMLSRAGIPSEK